MAVIDFSDEEIYVQWYEEFTRAYYDPNIRFIFLKGGAGAGKSVLVAQILLQNMDDYKYLCVRKIYETIRDSIHAEFVSAIDDWDLTNHGRGYINRPPEIKYNDKKTVVYKGMQYEKDREKLKSIEGIDQVWIEEATELTKEDFDQINLRVRSGNNNKIICTFNPTNGESWIKQDVEDKWENWEEQSVYIQKTPFDNQFLPEGYMQALEKMKAKNEEYYNIYVLNQRGQGMKGRIYDNYKVFDWDITRPDVIGLDFGYNDPNAMVFLKVKDTEGKDKKDLYVQEKLYQSHMTATDLINWMNSNNIPRDIMIVCDEARPEIIEQLNGAGYTAIAGAKGKGSVQNGITQVKEFDLHLQGKNLLKEGGSYVWKIDKNGNPLDVPIKHNDHLLDAMRYAVMEHYGVALDIDIEIG